MLTYQRYDTRPAGDLRTPPTGPSPQGDRKMKEYNLKKEATPWFSFILSGNDLGKERAHLGAPYRSTLPLAPVR